MLWHRILRTAIRSPNHFSTCMRSCSSITETASAALRKGFERSSAAEDTKNVLEHPIPSSSPMFEEAIETNVVCQESEHHLSPKIVVVGVGGGGCNAVNNMISKGLAGVKYVVANTDAQHLKTSLTENRVQLGEDLTCGLGCGANPQMGQLAAEAALDQVLAQIGPDANMVFLAAGMGGGTGTGATPVIARATRAADILTVAVVTKPFRFEGSHRLQLAEAGLEELRQAVDTMIVIPNQNLFDLSTAQTSLIDAFTMADHVLLNGVKNITDLMVQPGLINLDFADVQSVMTKMGHAIMGVGEAEGENRAVNAAKTALSNPLLGAMSVKESRGLLVNITGGSDMTLFEVDEAANRITQEVKDPMANIIFGSTCDRAMEGKIRVSVVATGISDPCAARDEHFSPQMAEQ